MNNMKKPTEAAALTSICGDIRSKNKIDENQSEQLSSMFGSRFVKAEEAIAEGRVKKYIFQPSGRIVWIVVGKQRDYLVMPAADFCSCEDFYFRFDRGHVCYHIIAQKIAEATGKFALFEDDDNFYEILIREWKNFKTKASKTSEERNTV